MVSTWRVDRVETAHGQRLQHGFPGLSLLGWPLPGRALPLLPINPAGSLPFTRGLRKLAFFSSVPFCSQFLLTLQGREQGSGGSHSGQPWDGTALVVPWHFPFSSLLSQPWLWVSPPPCPCLAAMALLLVTKRNFHTSAWSTPGP